MIVFGRFPILIVQHFIFRFCYLHTHVCDCYGEEWRWWSFCGGFSSSEREACPVPSEDILCICAHEACWPDVTTKWWSEH